MSVNLIVALWMIAEIIADKLSGREWHLRNPGLWAKLLLVLCNLCAPSSVIGYFQRRFRDVSAFLNAPRLLCYSFHRLQLGVNHLHRNAVCRSAVVTASL